MRKRFLARDFKREPEYSVSYVIDGSCFSCRSPNGKEGQRKLRKNQILIRKNNRENQVFTKELKEDYVDSLSQITSCASVSFV